jgi:small subunit ribosomal protein S6
LSHSYETVVVFDGTLTDDLLRKEQAGVEGFLAKNAEFEKTVVWGKQEMAYQIRRKRTGYYCLFLYKGEGDVVARLDADFRLNQNVLRHLTVLQTGTAPATPAAVTAPVVPATVAAPAASAAVAAPVAPTHEEAQHV